MPRATSKILRVSYDDISDLIGATPGETEYNIQRVVSDINWSQVEDVVNDQLPDGFYCKIEDA